MFERHYCKVHRHIGDQWLQCPPHIWLRVVVASSVALVLLAIGLYFEFDPLVKGFEFAGAAVADLIVKLGTNID
jgi:ethanolamine transporter EutH